MKVLLFRSAILIFFVLLQLSFFDIVFPWFHTPLLLLSCIVAWTLILGFSESLWLTVPIALVFEILSSGVVGSFSLYAVLLSYATSFLSRRVSIGHQGAGIGLYALFASCGTITYQGLTYILLHSWTEMLDPEILRFPSEFQLGIPLLSMILTFPIFFVSYSIIRRFEEWMRAMAQKQFLNVR